ncbi:ATP-dependent DNA helicase [Parashewanella curva]|uniref:ATP-dependent DNA helicase n=1 Tax=Parashewanella curva TaxID=2338552 RepID=A0A3L8PT93_9GAMM|nr:ATP-dependent DNA helicase [Parashewanella curva]RLV58657.1 ATP-dependent DNA helicase [Parashewanella curva]
MKKLALNNRFQQLVDQYFADIGYLAQSIRGYRFREGQKYMAELVAQTIINNDNAVIEAGTGIGKSFGYLIPALLSNKKVVISTATKNLQQQLYDKDLPAIVTMVNPKLKVSILKGVANYLCKLKLQYQLNHAVSHDQVFLAELLRINQWQMVSKDGDLNKLNTVSEKADSVQSVRTDYTSCTGKACEFYADCFFKRAASHANQADVAILNHHILAKEVQNYTQCDSKILNDEAVLIVDEAHSFPDVIAETCGVNISFYQVIRTIDAFFQAYKLEAGDIPALERSHQTFLKTSETLRLLIKTKEQFRINFDLLLKERNSAHVWWQWLIAIKEMKNLLSLLEGRLSELPLYDAQLEDITKQLDGLSQHQTIGTYVVIESHLHYIRFKEVLINSSSKMKAIVDSSITCIFTSATMQIDGTLSYIKEQLGLKSCIEAIIATPFLYQQHAMLYVPQYTNLDDIRVCIDLIDKNKGRTFILCSSIEAINRFANGLVGKIDHPLLIQGQSGREALIQKYRVLGNAVLIGSFSFWEGVDIKGRLLSNVIIDKLPFASPDDALIDAKLKVAELDNINGFEQVLLPKAVLRFKQGVGRLLRHETDKGLITLLDDRIINKSYGKTFIDSVPPIRKTRKHATAMAFLEKLQ